MAEHDCRPLPYPGRMPSSTSARYGQLAEVSMTLWKHRMGRRAGVLLDLVLSLGLIILGAYALESIGLTFGHLLHGALRFFGV